MFKRIVSVCIIVLSCAFAAQAQQPHKTVEIGMLSTTHILFTSDLMYVDISSPECIVAKVVDASKNLLALKARKEFPFETTVSALEANGTMHTFFVRFNASPSVLVIDTRIEDGASQYSGQVNTQIRPTQQAQQVQQQDDRQQAVTVTTSGNGKVSKTGKQKADKGRGGRDKAPAQASGTGVNVTSTQTSNFGRSNAPTLEEVMHKPRELYHATDKLYGLEAAVVNIYAYSDLTYIIIDLQNNSDIGYEAGDAQFTVETKRISSKQLSTDKSIWPKSSYGSLSCPPRSSTRVGYTIPKLTLQKNEVLKVYIYEKGGSRNLFLTLDDQDVNFAVSPVKN